MKDGNWDNLKGIVFDYGRAARVGLPEAVFCEKKTFSGLKQLLERFANGDPPILFTRLRKDIFKAVPQNIREAYDYDPVSGTAFAASLPSCERGRVAVVSAGTADAPVTWEAARTLQYLGIAHNVYEDCGIAGLWRLLERAPEINAHDVLIVVAGMEGALASVAAGLCPKPVFAVPTSVGYGVGEGGKAALWGMLASCAPGIGVLNIDNGYGAACAAARVVNNL